MKVISFCGFKGGTGKTTLAVNCCRYLHFYEEQRVSLLHVDPHQVLPSLAMSQQCPFLIDTAKFASINETYIEKHSNNDFLIIDCPSAFSADYLSVLPLVDMMIVPFIYSLLDYYKLLAFAQVLDKLAIPAAKARFLPNLYSDRLYKAGSVEKMIKDQALLRDIKILPSIPRNKQMTHLQLGNLLPTELNIIRPAFINIMRIEDILT